MLFQNILILFGLIAIAATKSIKSDYDQVEVSDIQRLIKSLQNNGNVGSSHRHHHKRHHKNQHSDPRHEDDHKLLNIQTLNLVFKDNNLRGDQPVESYDVIAKDGNNAELEEEAKNDIESLLNDLEQKLHVNDQGRGKNDILRINDRDDDDDDEDGKNNLRCSCSRAYDKRDDNLRCSCSRAGDKRDVSLRCGCSRTDDRDDNLRCGCSRTDNRDDNLRCGCSRTDDRDGNLRCGCSRADDKIDESLRCSCSRADDNGDDSLRCGCSRADDKRDNNLRCGCSRSDDRDDNLRCGCSRTDDRDDNLRCGCSRSDDRDDNLRCGCSGRSRADDDSDDRRDDSKNNESRDIKGVFKSVLDIYGKRYKLNNELDAVILDVDKINNVLHAFDDDSNNDGKSEEVTDKLKNKDKRYFLDRLQSKLAKNRFRDRPRLPLTLNEKIMQLMQQGHEERERVPVPESLVNKIPYFIENPSKLRSILPLTIQQKERLKKQQVNGDKEKVPVPFVIEVQGLGQVNA